MAFAEATLAQVAQGLQAAGFAVLPAALPSDLIDGLYREQQQLFAAGHARPAAIGRGAAREVRRATRGDEILWLDPAALTRAQTEYWHAIDALRHHLNRELFLGLNDFEAHFARYPAGAGYARHRDTFRDDDKRRVSCTLYLNPEWRTVDGGCLRLYPPAAAPIEVLPTAGTMAIFLAHELEHEVLPTQRPRHSLTGWLKSR